MRPVRRAGFTLLELIVSLSMMSVLMIGIGSALVIASRALPSEEHPLTAQVHAAQVVDMLVGDLLCAQSVPASSDKAITLTVADRNHDDVPEQLRYAWSGTPGDPLVRSINGGTDETLVSGVSNFTLTYDLRVEEQEQSANPNESAESLLFSHDTNSNLNEGYVQDDQWWGQYFKPALPADAVSWSVTRTKFSVRRRQDEPATTKIELRLPNADLTPSGTVIDRVTMEQMSLPKGWTWIEKSFVNASGLNPAKGLCLTLTTSSDDAASIRYRKENVTLSGSALLFGNPTWQTPQTDQALLLYVYGTVTTTGQPTITTVSHLVRVRINLTLVRAPDEPIETTIQLLNAPEV